jgi:hypothetical protein
MLTITDWGGALSPPVFAEGLHEGGKRVHATFRHRSALMQRDRQETKMPVSETPLIERVARVLAAAAHSSNAEGSEPSAAEKIDRVWHEHLNQAIAVLHTMREPDEAMAAVGDESAWSRMIDAAMSRYSFGGEATLGGGSRAE